MHFCVPWLCELGMMSLLPVSVYRIWWWREWYYTKIKTRSVKAIDPEISHDIFKKSYPMLLAFLEAAYNGE